jgi:hypothetical protein
MGNNHAIIIRMNYPQCEEWEWRLAYFKSIVLPRLLNQTDQDFDIVILCNLIHNKILESLSSKIKVINKEVGSQYLGTLLKDKTKKYGSKSVNPFYYKLDYSIQTRLDSDDLVDLDFVKFINNYLKNCKNLTLLCFKPKKFSFQDLKLYEIGLPLKDFEKSQFLTLFDPSKTRFIYEFGHTTWASKVKELKGDIKIIEGYCYLIHHGHNASTKIKDRDYEFKY